MTMAKFNKTFFSMIKKNNINLVNCPNLLMRGIAR